MHWFLETFAYLAAQLCVVTGKTAIRLLPRGFLVAVFRRFADLGYHVSRSFRERSIRNVGLAFGSRLSAQEIRDIVQNSMRNFLRAFLELGFAVDGGLERLRAEVPANGLQHLEAALAKGNGVIALSAHLGNFLLVGSRLAAEGYPIYVLINQPRAGKVNELRSRYRSQIGQRTIHAHPRDEAFRELVQVLRRNEIAMVIADEFRSGSGIRVPFFGRTVIARRGPATLALRTGAAVLPVYLVRGPAGELALRIEPEIEFVHTGKIKTDVIENTIEMTRWLERTVRAYPDQWNWMTIHWQEGKPEAAAREPAGCKEAPQRTL